MSYDFFFFLNSILLGVGLAMDAFSVSIANGLAEPGMKKSKQMAMSGTYAVFQFLMPMIGWVCVHTLVEYFTAFQKFIPWIALALLGYIGGSMLYEGIRNKKTGDPTEHPVRARDILIQGIATSIDALSVGFTISDYGVDMALCASLIIALVTFGLCMAGGAIGKKFGMKLAGKASILGGIILIGIGIEIFLRGIL
ncbi:MAG: manganese efflux pump MntP family protein [Oscillospiraceae bacterium]|jgi:putative Mn2+ efflux pump MntP